MFCPKCGGNNPDDTTRCRQCGAALSHPNNQPNASGNGPAQKTSGMAVTALVLGLVSFVPLFGWLLFGVPGVILGIVAIRRTGRQSGLKGGGLAVAGLVLSVVGGAFSLSFLMLAAIAVPNFLEANVRSKVSRAKSDMRSMATAVESYYIDNNQYPAWTADPEQTVAPMPEGIPTFRRAEPDAFHGLTTPIAYITMHPSDPFAQSPAATVGYMAAQYGWIVFSPGPDRTYDLNASNLPQVYDPAAKQIPSDALIALTYDPTNGTISHGDLWRVKQ